MHPQDFPLNRQVAGTELQMGTKPGGSSHWSNAVTGPPGAKEFSKTDINCLAASCRLEGRQCAGFLKLSRDEIY